MDEYYNGKDITCFTLDEIYEHLILNKTDIINILKHEEKKIINNITQREYRKNVIISIINSFISKVEKSVIPDLSLQPDIMSYVIVMNNSDIRLIIRDYIFTDCSLCVNRSTIFLSYKVKMISVSNYAHIYNIAPTTIRDWIRRGKIHNVKKQGFTWYISELALPTSGRNQDSSYLLDRRIYPLESLLSFVNDYDRIRIKKANSVDKYEIVLEGEDQKNILLSTNEKERLENAIVSSNCTYLDDSIIFEELFKK